MNAPVRHSRSMKSGDDADIGTPPCILKVLEKLKIENEFCTCLYFKKLFTYILHIILHYLRPDILQEHRKKYHLITDNFKSGDASSSKNWSSNRLFTWIVFSKHHHWRIQNSYIRSPMHWDYISNCIFKPLDSFSVPDTFGLHSDYISVTFLARSFDFILSYLIFVPLKIGQRTSQFWK